MGSLRGHRQRSQCPATFSRWGLAHGGSSCRDVSNAAFFPSSFEFALCLDPNLLHMAQGIGRILHCDCVYRIEARPVAPCQRNCPRARLFKPSLRCCLRCRFRVVVAPWFIWSRLWLQIPSDLVAQNLLQAGQRWIDFAWVRSLNLVATLAPLHLQIYPYEAAAVFRSASVNLCGAMGLIPALFLLRDWIKRPGYHLTVAAFPILLPALLLVAIFSGPAIPAVHGLQPLVVMGLATAVSGSDPVTRCRLILLGLIGQVVINLLLTGQYLAGIL